MEQASWKSAASETPGIEHVADRGKLWRLRPRQAMVVATETNVAGGMKPLVLV
jgi:hypothetical protein